MLAPMVRMPPQFPARLERAAWLFVTAVLTTLWGYSFYRFSDVGLEPTDSAFWLEHRLSPKDIENQLTT